MLPYYSDFSHNSLLITQGKLPEGLLAAKTLKKLMDEDLAFWESRDKMIQSGHLLYAYNLLRIAALEREVGSREGELRAWDEFLSHAGWEKGKTSTVRTADAEAYTLLAQAFQDGDVSLLDFIEQRKSELSH